MKQRKDWIRHQSHRQQLRHLRQRCARIVRSKDPAVIAAGRRVIDAVIDEPDPEYGALHLMAAALDVSEATGVPWAACADDLLRRFDAQAAG